MILYRLGAASLIAAAAFAGTLALQSRSDCEQAQIPIIPSKVQPQPLPLLDKGESKTILARSPFAHDRAPFIRNAPPPPPPLELRLAGISRLGDTMRATLVVGTQSLSVAVGDTTPVGPITSVTADAVEIGGATPRRIELFKQ
jgi:hypothetical protein